MKSLSKIIASVAVGAVVIAAGSAYAVMSHGGEPATVRINYAVPYTQGFSNATGWNCAMSGGGEGVLSFRDRWNGSWEFANNDFTSFTWATCQNGWATPYLNVPANRPTTVAHAPRVNLSTLPLMR